jgi:hypothetical protein
VPRLLTLPLFFIQDSHLNPLRSWDCVNVKWLLHFDKFFWGVHLTCHDVNIEWPHVNHFETISNVVRGQSLFESQWNCHNHRLGLSTKAKACEGASQKKKLGSVRECEGMNPHTPMWVPICSLGFTTKARAYKGASQKKKLKNVGECEGMNLRTPKWAPTCSLGFTTKSRVCEGASQERKFESVGECEGMNLRTPKWAPTLGIGVSLDFQIFKEQFQGSKPIGLWDSLYHWKAFGT